MTEIFRVEDMYDDSDSDSDSASCILSVRSGL